MGRPQCPGPTGPAAGGGGTRQVDERLVAAAPATVFRAPPPDPPPLPLLVLHLGRHYSPTYTYFRQTAAHPPIPLSPRHVPAFCRPRRVAAAHRCPLRARHVRLCWQRWGVGPGSRHPLPADGWPDHLLFHCLPSCRRPAGTHGAGHAPVVVAVVIVVIIVVVVACPELLEAERRGAAVGHAAPRGF